MKRKVLAIIQARMSSSRLAGKVLLPLAGEPVLFHIFNRLDNCNNLDQIIVATSKEDDDDKIIDFCEQAKREYFRGSLNDVLDRYYEAAKRYNASHIVRITADCPLIDPSIVDSIVSNILHCDFAALSGPFPDGLDCQAFTFELLEHTWKNAKLNSEREHVCSFMEKSIKDINAQLVFKFQEFSEFRLTLDQQEDYRLLQKIYSKFYQEGQIINIKDVFSYLSENPEIQLINSWITRNEGYLKSLEADYKKQ